MDQTGHVGPALGLHRDAVAVAPHGDDAVLQIFGKAGGADHLVQLVPHPLVRAANLPPNLVKLRRSPVGDLLFAQNRVVDVGLHPFQHSQPGSQPRQNGGVVPIAHQRTPSSAGGAEKGGNVQQHPGAQTRALLGTGNGLPHVRVADQRVLPQIGQQHHGLLRFRKGVVHIPQIMTGNQLQTALPAFLGDGVLGQHFPYFGKFQYAQRTILFHKDSFSPEGRDERFIPRPAASVRRWRLRRGERADRPAGPQTAPSGGAAPPEARW